MKSVRQLTARPDLAMVMAMGMLLGVTAFAQFISDLGFTTRVSPALISNYAQRFGPAAPDRLTQWIWFAREHKSAPSSERPEAARNLAPDLLKSVNDSINTRVKWVDDRVHWSAEDYWATPAESIGSAGGDCEDYAIAKYYLLKELGIPLARLRITYVRALSLNGQAHMVLAYYARPDADPLILDNLDPIIRVASRRADLEPVYSFNDDEVQLVNDARRGKPSQIRAWLSVQERLIAESRS